MRIGWRGGVGGGWFAGVLGAHRRCWLNPRSKSMKVGLEHPDAPCVRKYSAGECRRLRTLLCDVRRVFERFPVRSRLHKGWKGAAYRYAVSVYAATTDKVEVNEVTDPSSVALTLNSTHSFLVDLADPAYRPRHWERAKQPVVAPPAPAISPLPPPGAVPMWAAAQAR